MTNAKIEEFRAKEEECRRRAERITFAPDKEKWLRFAQEWQALADRAEAQHIQGTHYQAQPRSDDE